MQPLYIIVLMLLYGFAFLPSMYCVQYFFNGPATGYVVVLFFNILTGKNFVLCFIIELLYMYTIMLKFSLWTA